MFTIWKFTLQPTEMQDIQIPLNAEVLTVQNQNENICMWVKLDTNEPNVYRTFSVLGTGWSMVSNGNHKYIGTVQLDNGTLVFHVFEWIMKEI